MRYLRHLRALNNYLVFLHFLRNKNNTDLINLSEMELVDNIDKGVNFET
jgi:hypothetical protein